MLQFPPCEAATPRAIIAYRQQHGGRLLFAPSDVVFSPTNVIQPDLLYFSKNREHLVLPDRPTEAPPDLTVEVVSPGTSAHDRGRKQALCARFGVREYWIVDPSERAVEVFVLERETYRLGQRAAMAAVVVSAALPGFRAETARIFDLA